MRQIFLNRASFWRSSGFTGSPDRCQPFLQRPARSFRKGLAEIGRPFRRAAWPCATTSASEKFSMRLPCSFLFIVEEIILRQMRSHRGGYTRSKMASELKSTPTHTTARSRCSLPPLTTRRGAAATPVPSSCRPRRRTNSERRPYSILAWPFLSIRLPYGTGTRRLSSSNQFWTTTRARWSGVSPAKPPSRIMRNRSPSGETSYD